MFLTSLSFLWIALACTKAPALTAMVHAAGLPPLNHVIVVVMENKSYDQARTAPYIGSLVASGSSFSDYHAITHPSQPNYVALWSGSTQGVTDDACPAPGSPFMGENLGHACEAAGLTWRAYAEDLPAVGSSDCKGDSGLYARKHDPWTDFANLNHQNERSYTDLAADIAAGNLPALAFVIPNNCDDMHSCPIEKGDAWLSSNLPAMLDAVGPRGIVVLTWDEDDHGPTNQILTVISGDPAKHGYISSRRITHYTLLRTICEALHLPAFGAARSETPITDVWMEAKSAPVASAQDPPSSEGPAQAQAIGPVSIPAAPVPSVESPRSRPGARAEGRLGMGAESQPLAAAGPQEARPEGAPNELHDGKLVDQPVAIAAGKGGESGDQVEPGEHDHHHHHDRHAADLVASRASSDQGEREEHHHHHHHHHHRA